MKIASKISISSPILIVMGVSILTAVFYTIIGNNLKESIYSNLKEVAQSRVDIVKTFLDSGRESVRQPLQELRNKRLSSRIHEMSWLDYPRAKHMRLVPICR